jgi:hypothetical protein
MPTRQIAQFGEGNFSPSTLSGVVEQRAGQQSILGRFLGPRASSLLPTQTKGGEQVRLPGRQLSGNQGSLRASGSGALVDPTQLDFGVDRLPDAGAPQIEDLLLTGEQQGALSALRRTAAAGGLRGGAVTSGIERSANQFLQANQAQNFQNVIGAARARTSAVNEVISPFLSQVGLLETFRDQGGVGHRAVGVAGGLGQEDFRTFARPLIDALASLGQERAATAGILLGQDSGVDVSQFGLSSHEMNLARAVQSFLNPEVTGGQQAQINERFAAGGILNRRSRAAGTTAALADTRLQAGQFLAKSLQAPASRLNRAATELQAGGQSAAALLAARFTGGQLDLSEFRGARELVNTPFNQIGNVGAFQVAPLNPAALPVAARSR